MSVVFLVLMIVFALVFFLPPAIDPRIWWKLTRWRYRNPEMNEPSETVFTLTRVASMVMLFLLPIGGVAVIRAEGQAEERSEELREQRQQTMEDLNEQTENAESRDLGLEPGPAGRYGHVIGYEGGTDTGALGVVYINSGCASLDEATVEESDDEVELHLVETRNLGSFDDVCSVSFRGTSPETEEIELDEPLGDRRVVLTSGEEVPECGADCEDEEAAGTRSRVPRP